MKRVHKNMALQNVCLFDSNEQEARDFIRGLEKSTNLEWRAIVCTSNQGRTCKFSNFLRYVKYFVFPFLIFLRRKKFNIIIGWQEFYGLIFAFYCRLFHIKKVNKLLIKNLTYKPKKGITGKIYYRFMKYIIKSEYVDVFVCTSQTNADYCASVFNESPDRFVFIPFGVNDFTKIVDFSVPSKNEYILSLGRSNRDWDFLIDSLANSKYPVRIVCDELYRDNLAPNIEIIHNVWGNDSYEFIKNCRFMIIPILDGKVASGETVLIKAMSFSKPIIITKPSCLADDYVTNEETGLVVAKNKDELLEAVERLWNDRGLHEKISHNCRLCYENKHSLLNYGNNVGRTLIEKNCVS